MTELVGRQTETEVLLGCFERAERGPVAVVLEGQAGIGKTSLWKMALTQAGERGARIMTAQAAEFERELSFITLSDLLGSVADEEIATLPQIQRSSLNAALLRAEDDATDTDWRAVAAGVLGLLRAFSREGPLVVAIDDVQWLDRSSAKVLGTALRRLESEPVLVTMTRRTPAAPGSFDPNELFRDNLQVIEVPPLDMDQLEQVIRSRLDRHPDPPTMRKIHQASGGNPFYAIEIARSLGDTDLSRGDPLPVPTTLTKIIRDRLSDLSDVALQVLLVAASAAIPTMDLVEQALGDTAAAAAGVEEARRADVLDRRGEPLRFTHPLFASTIYEATDANDRRALHNRLSELVDDIEQRAAHLARARTAPNEEVASALDDAAAAAKARGAIERAAELAWTAVDFTPEQSVIARAERTARAADHTLMVGNRGRVAAALEEALGEVPPGPTRARLWLVYAEVAPRMADTIRGLEEVLDHCGEDRSLQVSLLISRANLLLVHGDTAAGEREAERAVSIARSVPDRVVLAKALSELAAQRTIGGHTDADRTLAEALSMPEAQQIDPVYSSPFLVQGLAAERDGDLDAARAIYDELLRRAEERGDMSSYSGVLFHLIQTEVRAGRFERAGALADAVGRIDAEGPQDQWSSMTCFARGLADVSLGRVEEARTSAAEGARIAEQLGDALFLSLNRWVLGLVALTEGDFAAASRQMGDLPAVREGFGDDLDALLFDADLIEALVAEGRLDEAQTHLDELQRRSEVRGRTRGLALAARCRGMIAERQGRLEDALAALDRALDLLGKIQDHPFERARTLLVKGIVERRIKQRGAARESLGRARELFIALGNPRWAEKAEVEARRIGGRAPSTHAMTPTEEQVADLVAAGLSNREVAERLYLSVKTVEANLSRIYRKLDVRSRTQLAQKLRNDPAAARQT